MVFRKSIETLSEEEISQQTSLKNLNPLLSEDMVLDALQTFERRSRFLFQGAVKERRSPIPCLRTALSKKICTL